MNVRRPVLALLIAVIAVGAIVAPSAGARSERLTTFFISFDGVYKQGEPVKVKNLVYSNLPLTCTEGPVTYSPSKKFPKTTVNRKLKFKATLKADGITSKVVGKYKRDLSKVTGTVKATGATGGNTNCSGKTAWETN